MRRLLTIAAVSLALPAAPASAQVTITYTPNTHSIRVEGDSASDDIYVEESDYQLSVTNPSSAPITAPDGCTDTQDYWIRCPRAPDADGYFDVVIDGGGGNDLIRLGCSSGVLFPDGAEVYGGAGDDQICGSFADEYIEGGPGDDKIDASKGDDWVVGGGSLAVGETAGTDLVYGGPGSDLVSDGDDDSSAAPGAVDDDHLSGGACSEVESFCRGELPELGDLDTVDWSNRTDAVALDLTDLTAPHGRAGESDTLQLFEGAIGGAGNDTFTGDDDDNYFNGGAGTDTIAAAGGADYLVPGSDSGHQDGTDTVDGGDGEDLVSYEDRVDPVRVDLTQGKFGDIGEQELDDVTNVEDASGGGGNDSLVGDSRANTIYGLAGDDFIDVSHDGVADFADCGRGSDAIVAEAIDETVNCEPPGDPAPPPTAGTPPPPAPTVAHPTGGSTFVAVAPVTIALTRAKPVRVTRKGAFDVPFARLTCPFSLPDKCTVFIQLFAANGRGKPLGTKGMIIAAGKTLALHSALNARAMRILRRRGRLVALVRIDGVHSGAHLQREFKLTLLPPRRR